MTTRQQEPRDFIPYPLERVVGTIADARNARSAVETLLREGFQQTDIDILHGDEDLQRLDPTGSEHGFLARFQRTLIRMLTLEGHKATVTAFYDLMFNQSQPAEAVRRYVGVDLNSRKTCRSIDVRDADLEGVGR